MGDGEGYDRLLGFWQGQLPVTLRESLSQKIHVALPHLCYLEEPSGVGAVLRSSA